MEILVNSFGELKDDFEQEEKAAIRAVLDKLESYPDGHIPAEVGVKNIGRGADYYVVSISILSAASVLFFAIPTAHKKVRESLEEWKRIYNEFSRLISWFAFSSPIYYPEHYLFLVALLKLDEDTEASELTFLSCHAIPEDNPDLKGLESLIFNFQDGDVLESVAVTRQGKLLWHNTTELGHQSA
jgi:hypothetical protein